MYIVHIAYTAKVRRGLKIHTMITLTHHIMYHVIVLNNNTPLQYQSTHHSTTNLYIGRRLIYSPTTPQYEYRRAVTGSDPLTLACANFFDHHFFIFY